MPLHEIRIRATVVQEEICIVRAESPEEAAEKARAGDTLFSEVQGTVRVLDRVLDGMPIRLDDEVEAHRMESPLDEAEIRDQEPECQ
ncbi:hypothetical protein LAZ40_03245 [Cereibacter sphaeroides]|uniref:hypothetical protein n=1 Tax=Cereibacter sphaeroides TaxID=1063 RepID=UPI001F30C7D4|nr:hypothetical protein [Cereibacter sphaeroides]MCE6958071.1 hypothetical protein [Cereibacter sphaeroides]MCE6971318.1 hypothetical protein [Cereibacter sphaeroides]